MSTCSECAAKAAEIDRLRKALEAIAEASGPRRRGEAATAEVRLGAGLCGKR